MKRFNHAMLAGTAMLALSGCGVETASTAATVAAGKVQETRAAKQTLDAVRGKLDAAQQAQIQRAERRRHVGHRPVHRSGQRLGRAGRSRLARRARSDLRHRASAR